MSTDRWRCACTNAAADVCNVDETFIPRNLDGSCGCSCHITYSDDPENWQPLSMTKTMINAEFAAIDDWLERLDAAEALTDEAQS
jgi:hypothetical protein